MSLADPFESSLFAAVDEAANAPAPIGHGGSISTDMTSGANAVGAVHESDPFFSHGTEPIDYLGIPDTTRVRERSVTDAPLPKFFPVGAAPGARALRPKAPPHIRPPESLLARPRAISVGTLEGPNATRPAQAGALHPSARMHRATQSFEIKSRAPGHGR